MALAMRGTAKYPDCKLSEHCARLIFSLFSPYLSTSDPTWRHGVQVLQKIYETDEQEDLLVSIMYSSSTQDGT